MPDMPIHPAYQHRHVDADGHSLIVAEEALGPLVAAGSDLRFGYWRPHAFVELASLSMSGDSAVMEGIQGDRIVPAGDGADPEAILTEWCAHAHEARRTDMADREGALLDRKSRDAAYVTRFAGGDAAGTEVGSHELAVRMAIQAMAELVNGTWVGKHLAREVARLAWQPDRTILMTAADRRMVCAAPVDLDAAVGVWMAFVGSAREALEFEDTISAVRQGIAAEDGTAGS